MLILLGELRSITNPHTRRYLESLKLVGEGFPPLLKGLQVVGQRREAFGADAAEQEVDLLRGGRDLGRRQPAEDDVVFVHRNQVDVGLFAIRRTQRSQVETIEAT